VLFSFAEKATTFNILAFSIAPKSEYDIKQYAVEFGGGDNATPVFPLKSFFIT